MIQNRRHRLVEDGGSGLAQVSELGGYAGQIAGEVKTRDERVLQDGVVRIHPRIDYGHNPDTGGQELMSLGSPDQHGGRLVDVAAQHRAAEEGDRTWSSQRV